MQRKIRNIIVWMTMYSSIRMMIGSTSSLFLISKGLAVENIIKLKGLQFLSIFLFEIPFGYLSDKKSKKLSVMIAVLCSMVWMSITAYSPTVIFLYIGEFFNALSIAALSGAFDAILIQNYKKLYGNNANLEKVIGNLKKYQFIGMFFSVLISSLFFKSDSSFFWWLGALLLLLQLILFSSAIPADIPELSVRKDTKKYFSFLHEIKNVCKDLDNKNYFYKFLFVQFLFWLYFQVIIQYWQVIYQYFLHNYLQRDIKFLFGLMFSMILLVQSLSGFFVSKQNISIKTNFYKINSLLFFLSMVFLYIGMQYKQYSFFIVISLLTIFFITSNFTISTSAVINYMIKDDNRALCLSVISTIFRIAIFLLSFLLSPLIKNNTLYFFIAMGLVISLLSLFIPMDKMKKRLYANYERE